MFASIYIVHICWVLFLKLIQRGALANLSMTLLIIKMVFGKRHSYGSVHITFVIILITIKYYYIITYVRLQRIISLFTFQPETSHQLHNNPMPSCAVPDDPILLLSLENGLV